MKTSPQRNDYLTRDAILKLLSDEETARVSTRESGPPLAVGDEYVDLEQLALGVRRKDAKTAVDMGAVLPRRAVKDSTWSQICARLPTSHRA